jgi:hypothetical protein
MRRHAKRVGVFVVGWALIILAAAIGWLPGPGGIPLALLGLAVLATEFEWAARRQRQLRAYYHRKKDQMLRNHRERVEVRHVAADERRAAADERRAAADASEAAIIAEVETTATPPPVLARPASGDGSPVDR